MEHVALGTVAEQALQGGRRGKVAGVLQQDDQHAVRMRVHDAALCQLDHEARPAAGSEGWGHQQNYLPSQADRMSVQNYLHSQADRVSVQNHLHSQADGVSAVQSLL